LILKQPELYFGSNILPPSCYDLGAQFGGFQETVSSYNDNIWDYAFLSASDPGVKIIDADYDALFGDFICTPPTEKPEASAASPVDLW
jgi:hypothetical protein